jgi:hypothetical protein
LLTTFYLICLLVPRFIKNSHVQLAYGNELLTSVKPKQPPQRRHIS